MYPKPRKVRFAEGDCAALIECAEGQFYCPVCGFAGLSLMYPIEGREAWDFTICPSCWTELGADDVVTENHVKSGWRHVDRWKELRTQWLEKSHFNPTAVIQVQTLEAELEKIKDGEGRGG